MQKSNIKNIDQKSKTEFKLRLYKYCLRIIKFLKQLPKDYIFQTIGQQLLRSATSIAANYIEAKSASSKRDFLNYFNIALKSSNETPFLALFIKGYEIRKRRGKGINRRDERDCKYFSFKRFDNEKSKKFIGL